MGLNPFLSNKASVVLGCQTQTHTKGSFCHHCYCSDLLPSVAHTVVSHMAADTLATHTFLDTHTTNIQTLKLNHGGQQNLVDLCKTLTVTVKLVFNCLAQYVKRDKLCCNKPLQKKNPLLSNTGQIIYTCSLS